MALCRSRIITRGYKRRRHQPSEIRVIMAARLSPDVRRKIGELRMPTISMFYGILIRMFFYDTDKHNVPHIHAEYQGDVAVYSIHDGTVMAGKLPPKKHKLVVA